VGVGLLSEVGRVITEAILDFVFGGLEWAVDLLPTDTMDLSGLTALTASMGWLDSVFDMSALVGVVTFAIAAEVLFLGVKVALFVWRLTPFSG